MLRKTVSEEFEQVVSIIEDGKNFLKGQGVNQWQHGFPNKNNIEEDIKNKISYVYLFNNEIVATAMLCSYDEDYEKYKNIWGNSGTYLAVHRFAVADKHRGSGVTSKFLESIKNHAKDKKIKNLRIDTHEENKVMRKFLEKNNFVFCGEILLDLENPLDDKKRVAYELTL